MLSVTDVGVDVNTVQMFEKPPTPSTGATLCLDNGAGWTTISGTAEPIRYLGTATGYPTSWVAGAVVPAVSRIEVSGAHDTILAPLIDLQNLGSSRAFLVMVTGPGRVSAFDRRGKLLQARVFAPPAPLPTGLVMATGPIVGTG